MGTLYTTLEYTSNTCKLVVVAHQVQCICPVSHTSTASINAVLPSTALASISAFPYVRRFSISMVV